MCCTVCSHQTRYLDLWAIVRLDEYPIAHIIIRVL